jgi:hypothetical protein
MDDANRPFRPEDDPPPPPPGYDVIIERPKPIVDRSNAPACAEGRHIWLWDEGEPLPEGLVCECGELQAHYERCPLCGSRKLTGRHYRGHG